MNVHVPCGDTQWTETTIDKVSAFKSKRLSGWEISSGGWSLFVCSDLCEVEPQPGETIRLYGRGIGSPVRGIVIGSRTYRYETEEVHAERLLFEAAVRNKNRSDDYESKRDDYDARLARLPDPLIERIIGFRSAGGVEWQHEFEPYELFVCEQAAMIARELRTSDAVRAFNAKKWDEQKAALPELSSDHSGNTFGAACMLACALLDKPEIVPGIHGALCPLVGCETYRCYSVRQRREVMP